MASSYAELAARLRSQTIDDPFELLAAVSAFTSQTDEDQQSTDLVIRALDRISDFDEEKSMLWALARQHGLFPYISTDTGIEAYSNYKPAFRDMLALELHRPEGMDEVIFHRVQAQIYHRLRNGENVILSAPTSFGKSLIIDSLIAIGIFCNIVIIVPTIALIDETRRRLSRFSTYKVITHPSQTLDDRNLLVVTQERFLAFENLPTIDFFFIDEFYKLSERDERGEQLSTRAAILNQALRKLLASGAQYYMAGPSISSIDNLLPAEVRAAFFRTDYSTVAADTIRLRPKNDEERKANILEILAASDEPTLIYCQSPQRARRVLSWILEEFDARDSQTGLPDAAEWLRETYHHNWSLPAAIERGIGVHHGRLPRWLSQLMVESFNDGKLNVLICTNSLIEGVNTRAKRVIIVDRKIANSAYDYFTFANIRGRAGRMFKHFIGTVYLFHESPPPTLPDVDFPGLTQSDLAPDSLLISVDEEERSDRSRQRLSEILNQDVISEHTLRQNVGIDPASQVALARHLTRLDNTALISLSWSTPFPSYEQLQQILDLVWEFLRPAGFSAYGPTSASQLTFYTAKSASISGATSELIQEFVGSDEKWWRTNETLDDRIELAFAFTRFWLTHHLPTLISALDRIVGEIQVRRGLDRCNYTAYISRVESAFLPPYYLALEEYGMPAELLSRVFNSEGNPDETLDSLLAAVKTFAPTDENLHSFEIDLIRRFQTSV
ncbi:MULTISPECIES: DEAD/DEAH box helicase [Mycobacteriaceae]|uniref:DEAD/DEAH box helicase n=1 Tax=Mycobacteriaceae TaxID=1762 RepID=UPI0002F1368B|nr:MULTISPECIES: DEAD/DEAH box helicase [Mycobacteriaceae]AXK75864.1 helicase [Mycolicibacterium neoaurum]